MNNPPFCLPSDALPSYNHCLSLIEETLSTLLHALQNIAKNMMIKLQNTQRASQLKLTPTVAYMLSLILMAI